ncbi:hypothetical protein ITX31_09320 [Arthrobacter gandavensis]|uniref:DoxX family protein n=1 Tax=Arthrobacter gandavensis TaxID=169960 RepID=UPI001890986E|nr:hypothetical protein [Arthrobacter gandavensis]MBF4994310.1 hypothetical protein [Arthrobacter gandavensis]
MSRSALIHTLTARAPRTSRLRRAAAVVLGLFLAFAGTSHLTFAREEFQAQVPGWVPLDKDTVVLLSGIAEIGVGSALALLPSRRVPVGLAAAAFFIAIFPGNISQYVTRTDGFGLDTDQKRFIRLFFQPLLVIWALWSTGAWQALRNLRRH